VNHIIRLQIDLDAARAEITARDEAIQALLVHLDTAKFHGIDPDGARRDWIAVADVRAWLSVIREVGA
jgi:hypothetical protein